MSDRPTDPEVVLRSVDTIALARRTAFELARLETRSFPDELIDQFREWLHLLPLPDAQGVLDPVVDLAISVTPHRRSDGVATERAFERVTFHAAALVAPMIEPMATFLAAIDAHDHEMDRITDLGPVVRPDLLESWWSVTLDGVDLGWTMHGRLHAHAVARALDGDDQREQLRQLIDDHPEVVIVSVGRSVVGEQPVVKLRFQIDDTDRDGDEVDEDELVAVATACLSAFDAPLPPDDLLAIALATTEGCPVGATVWLLPQGLSRAGLTFGAVDETTIVTMAQHGHWTPSLERIAAVRGALGADEGDVTATLEVFVDADGPGSTLLFDAYRV